MLNFDHFFVFRGGNVEWYHLKFLFLCWSLWLLMLLYKILLFGWGIYTLFWGPTLTGLLYKWMAPPCNLLLTEEKTKMPDKCLGECMLKILTETLIKLSFTSIILSPLRIAHPCTSSKTQSPWSIGTNPLLNSSTTGSTADLVTIPPLVSQDPQGYNKNKA